VAIPDYQALMLPLLKLVAMRGKLNRSDAVQLISDELKLTDTERRELIPSGKFTVIRSRVGWARTYLKKAGLIEYPQRGIASITSQGNTVLSQNPNKIDVEYLRQFPVFNDFLTTSNKNIDNEIGESFSSSTPEEVLDTVYLQLKNQLLDELIEKIKSCSPQFFEQLVIDTIVKLGYGGSREDASQAIGRSGDEGIDGIINEDWLGLDVIYLQAKRWAGNVGRPDVQKFAGALQGKRARKGIFITTSDFTKEALDYVKHLDAKIILITGLQLAELMWRHNIGLNVTETYEIKKLELDYFNE
jgi:restriction system protein